MEEFDLVDDQDQVIGITNKQKAHQNGELHRVVAIFVFTADGKLYVQEHLKSGNIFDHSVGGHVKKGENYDDAAIREGEEELGIKNPLTHLTTFRSVERATEIPYMHMFAIYEVTPDASWKFQPNEEVKNIIPMEISEIVDLMNKDGKKFTGGFINTMREYLRLKNLPYSLN